MQHIVLVVPAESYRADAFLQAGARAAQQLTLLTDAQLPLGDQTVHVSSMMPPDDEIQRLIDYLFGLGATLIIGVDEVSTRLAASLSDQLGLTIGKAEAVERSVDKVALRTTLMRAELGQPKFLVTTLHDLNNLKATEIDALVANFGGSFIVKPTRQTASRGVIRVNAANLIDDIDPLREIQEPSAPLLLESYVEGPEFAVEGILNGDQLEVLMIFAKPDIGEGPYFWESTYLGPAKVSAKARRELINAVERGARALGLTNTPVHAELRLSEGRAVILEIAPRSIGGRCSAAIKFGDGQRLEDLILARALGDRGEIKQRNRAVGIYMIPTPARGILREVNGLDQARSVPGVTGVEITVSTGTMVYPPPLTDRYLGFIFAEAPGQAGALRALQRASALLTIVIEGG
ncbi:ATP-grasp domain-containing protein [Ferrimicrobium acidiphilum]|uniref:ATP-grasp domain-containing protein n=1 Tax=Ferrimicrobium acidiphilum TaxID=121039 RepID=UPI0023F19A4C|nr:ATP-grasp domain-containing protein [Ferrimicrobium acidiphilum]